MRPWLDAHRLRSIELDLRGARLLHLAASRPHLLRWLVLCSRLANAPLWLMLPVLLPLLDRQAGRHHALVVLALGAVNLLLYWGIKRGTRRQRPFEQCVDIRACMHVPDRFSFPSGHTLHAVAFALLLSGYYPWLAPLLWPFALLVATSRVVLGLHYPSDVLAGALIGAATAAVALLSG